MQLTNNREICFRSVFALEFWKVVFNELDTHTDIHLTPSSTQDFSGLVVTSQVMDQSLQLPLSLWQVLGQSIPVLKTGSILANTEIEFKR